MKKIDLCNMCIHDDFGYCGLRNSKLELQYKNDEDGDLTQCSSFSVDKERVNRMFKLKVTRKVNK